MDGVVFEVAILGAARQTGNTSPASRIGRQHVVIVAVVERRRNVHDHVLAHGIRHRISCAADAAIAGTGIFLEQARMALHAGVAGIEHCRPIAGIVGVLPAEGP